MSTPLVSLSRFKSSLGTLPNPSASNPKDQQYIDAIQAASALARSYTRLFFDVTADGAIATPRSFEYDGTGFLDIDEAQSVTDITLTAGYAGAQTIPLDAYTWGAYPSRWPVKLWLELPPTYYGGISPEMGFTYNLDMIGYRYPNRPSTVTVTAIWGWPEIPQDVQQAVIWIAQQIVESPRPYTSESIADYSHTRTAEPEIDPLPERAKIILDQYTKMQI